MPTDKAELERRLRAAMAQRQAVVVPRVAETEPAPDSDEAARKEASALAAGNLESQSAVKDFSRTERFRDHVAVAMLILFWLGFVVILVVAGAWGLNFFMPPEKAFLTAGQSNSVFSFLTGGGITSFVANYVKKRLT